MADRGLVDDDGRSRGSVGAPVPPEASPGGHDVQERGALGEDGGAAHLKQPPCAVDNKVPPDKDNAKGRQGLTNRGMRLWQRGYRYRTGSRLHCIV